ncbi:MAG: sodium-translocating pyrophosphatase [Hadesarchaea archaeon DG-33-1]|nr:MAG: sodium-translocating pyrophosphatase [Hadesarchaea archaeon DG-33-1]
MPEVEIILASTCGLLALIFAGLLIIKIMRKSQGSSRMKEISDTIHRGAMTFLNKEYKGIAIFVIVMAGILILAINLETALCFIFGASLSALAGNIGMRVATKSNARTAEAAKQSIGHGLKVGFSSGAVMGMCVVGLGLLGLSIAYNFFPNTEIIIGFGFGASSVALFARVGGGIYTKSADMGADLVGKVEARIPEDDPRNPAVIADNVGDNVGDVAGMGADLFESYVGSIIAAMAIGFAGATGGVKLDQTSAVMFPMLLAAGGIICSIVGTFFVRVRKGARIGDLHAALNKGVFGAAILIAIVAYFLVRETLGAMEVFYAMLAGLIAGIVIGLSAEYFTESRYSPVKLIATSSQTGPATNIISGFSVGMLSTMVPIIAVCVAIGFAFHFAEFYGIAIAGVGMLSTLGMTLATDTYGPVADNAAGIAEMTGMGQKVRVRAERLDAVGNTTAAIGKGFAIGSAALTALALFLAYTKAAEISTLDIVGEKGFLIIIGLFIGGMLPFLFSALTMRSVGKGASLIVTEVRMQFRRIPGLMRGKAKPNYDRCIEICTMGALKNMVLPALLAVVTPIAVGRILGPEALGGLLAGAIVTGFLLAITLANSGGAWDNAKKYIEEGKLGGKGSETHAASVIGDTVGDPFKDTSGPSLNILIKLMAMAALLFAPLFI